MKYILLLPVFLFLLSCNKEDNSQADIDDQIIQNYLTENNIDATKHSSGLYYIITVEGAGSHPNANSTVTVRYIGYLTDGTIFDQTEGSATATFGLTSLIEGWKIGIPLLKKEGKGTFFIPSGLGYGDRATGSIPANSVLVFDIDLINFQ